MTKAMRAKMMVTEVAKYGEGPNEKVSFRCVAKSDGPYPDDGSDEDNNFAKWSPDGMAYLAITNPELHGNFTAGQKFYVDFTPAE